MADILPSLAEGLVQAVTWPGLAFLLVGVGIGYLVGFLPGIGGPVAMALLLPAAFTLDTVASIALLMGVAASAVSAGEMTSILLGVPGEASAAAMLADGRRLAMRGEAGRAAGAAIGSSLAGGLIGAVVLALAVPVARPLFGSIASPEMLVLAVLGIALVAALSASAPAKGLVGGAIGLFLATVGLDPSDGVPRFTFGQLFLWDGVGLLPTALGLFAVPEAVALLQTPTSARTHAVAGHAWSGMREVWQHRRLVLRCSLIGTIIGVLPGIGATVSQWLAYAHAAQQSPRRLHFGTGEIEGVIGPGAASNATLGGDLVPTLALGIPGSLPTAILLGALVLEGLTPGPAMLLPEREGGHLALVFSFVWMVAIGNVAAAAISLAGLRQLTALTTIRPLLLFPLVMALVPVGAYAERHAAGDLALVAIMGLAGCVMARYDWPRAPVLLGLVFGPMLERRSLLTLEAYDATWVLRPGVLLLGAGAALVIWGSRRVARTVEPTVRPGAEWGDVVLSSLIAAFALAALLWTGTLSGAPAIVPRVTLGLTSTAAALIAVTTWRRLTHAATRVPPGRLPVHDLAWMMAFLAAPLVGGFVPAAALGTAAFLRTAARVSWARTLLVTAGISGVVAALQVYGLQGSRPGWW